MLKHNSFIFIILKHLSFYISSGRNYPHTNSHVINEANLLLLRKWAAASTKLTDWAKIGGNVAGNALCLKQSNLLLR